MHGGYHIIFVAQMYWKVDVQKARGYGRPALAIIIAPVHEFHSKSRWKAKRWNCSTSR